MLRDDAFGEDIETEVRAYDGADGPGDDCEPTQVFELELTYREHQTSEYFVLPEPEIAVRGRVRDAVGRLVGTSHGNPLSAPLFLNPDDFTT